MPGASRPRRGPGNHCLHHAHATQRGAEIIQAPVSQPYGVRDYGARDLEGHLWYFHSPLD